MQPRTAPSVFSISLALTLLAAAGGCASSADHRVTATAMPAPSATLPSGDEVQASSHSEREQRRQIQAMLEESLSASSMDKRAAAVLAASDFATGDVANTLAAIDTATRVVITNLENTDTTGFKPCIARVSGGTVVALVDTSQGFLENTGSPLDIAIVGDGYFPVKISDKNSDVGYTRAGSFSVNSCGNLVVNIGTGFMLTPPVTMPATATAISISADGTVTYVKAGATLKTTCGQLKLARFPAPQRLKYIGGSIYLETEDSGPAVHSFPGFDGVGILVPGFLEGSNVSLPRERLRLRFLSEWREALLRAIGERRDTPSRLR